MSSSDDPKPARVAVVGAGLAGLSAARALGEAGCAATLFDKGRRAGGRLSTRHAGEFDFDHGAQYLTARLPGFRALVDGLVGEGVLAEWRPRLARLGPGGSRPLASQERRYVGVPGMSALARALAPGLELREGLRVERVERQEAGWRLVDEDGATHPGFDAVIVTAPIEQARALLGGAFPAALARADEARLRPCLAVLLGLAGPYAVPFDAAFVDGSPLAWVARNSSKPGRPAGESWVLHAAHDWTEAHLEEDREVLAGRLVEELEALCDLALPPVVHRAAHLWRYALADPALDAGCLADRAGGLVLAGDWCAGNRVEGAWRSGRAAAAALLGGAAPA